MRKAGDMIPLEEAFRRLDDALAGLRLPVESLPTRSALGRVLAEDQHSRLDLPPFDKSAMDGYAIPSGQERDRYQLVGTVAAGQVPPHRLAPGVTVKVMTGAPVPPGTARVVMVEDTALEGETVVIRQRRTDTNICWRGEDVRVGDLVLPAGTPLTAADVANLIACGVTEVTVSARPRLAVLSTGQEIVDRVEEIGPGKIMNANGPLLVGLAREYGLEIVREASYPDDRAALVQGLESAAADSDLVVVSGGVSVGDFDLVPQALADLGFTLHFSRVAIKPGKPMTLATRGRQVVFGLPGNPVSVYLTFHLFVLRGVARLTGATLSARELRFSLGESFRRRRAERQEFVPARLTASGALLPLEFHGSAHLLALSQADGFFVVPIGVTSLDRDTVVQFVCWGRRWPW